MSARSRRCRPTCAIRVACARRSMAPMRSSISVGILAGTGTADVQVVHVAGRACRRQGGARSGRQAARARLGDRCRSQIPLALRALQGARRGSGARGVSRRHHPATVDRVRTGGRVLQPLRVHGTHLAAAAAHRRRQDEVPAGLSSAIVAAAIAAVVDGAGKPGTIYELGGPEMLSFRELLDRTQTLCGPQARLSLDAVLARQAAGAADMAAAEQPAAAHRRSGAAPRARQCRERGSRRRKGGPWRGSASEPRNSISAIVPAYLERFKPKGQYAHYKG